MDSQWLKTYGYGGFPTGAGALVLGLVLLVFKDLDADLRARLVPALVVYVLGLSLIAFVYFALDARNAARCAAACPRRTPGPQPRWVFISYVATQAAWLLLLVVYLFWKVVL